MNLSEPPHDQHITKEGAGPEATNPEQALSKAQGLGYGFRFSGLRFRFRVQNFSIGLKV